MTAEEGGRDVLIVAGEASGDLHGASLVRAMVRRAPHVKCFGVGGDRMEAAGVELLHHMRHLAVVGITEVLGHLGDVHRAMKALMAAADERSVDGVVLIDYPDFNVALAKRLRRRHPEVPIVYYISPQVWAWRKRRVRTLARLVDRMLVILPFEEELYEEAGVDAEFVGHPLLDVVQVRLSRELVARRYGVPVDGRWIALLPGSRPGEVERLLPPVLEAAATLVDRLGDGRSPAFLLAVADGVSDELYGECIEQGPDAARRATVAVKEDRYDVVHHSEAAVVCSGTATLETALLDTPMVVVYRTSWLTYTLAKLLVRIPDIALVNVVADRRGVPELVQGEVSGPRIADEVVDLLEGGEGRERVLETLEEVRRRLGRPGASDRAARSVLEVLGVERELPASATRSPAR